MRDEDAVHITDHDAALLDVEPEQPIGRTQGPGRHVPVLHVADVPPCRAGAGCGHEITCCEGRATSVGQIALAGQFSENQFMVFSKRRTWMSAPNSIAASFLVSPSARQLTVERSMPSAAA